MHTVLRCFHWNRPPQPWSSDGSTLGSRARNDQPPSAQEGTFSLRLEPKSFSYNLLESKTRFIALAEGMVTGLFLWRIRPETVPRLWPLACFPRLGDPSDLSLAPETAEPSGLLLVQPCTRPSWGLRRSLTVVPLSRGQRYYGEATARVL